MENVTNNVFKNEDIETRKEEFNKLLANLINKTEDNKVA